MRAIIGAMLVAGMVSGCGGVETVEENALPERDTHSQAAQCGPTSVCRTRYYYSGGVECGLTHIYCDGRRYHEGCQTSEFTQDYWCPEP